MSAAAEAYRLEPAEAVAGRIRVPGDKSISHRAVLLGGIARGVTEVTGFLRGEDCLATMTAMRRMGVRIEDDGSTVRIHGVGLDGLEAPDGPLDLGNSGTGMRLLAGLLAGQRFGSELVGDASLMRRPMARIADPLNAMGAGISTSGGRPPLVIEGGRPLHGIDYASPIASAQVKSALLLAGLYAEGTTTVREPGVSRDHTERMLQSMGASLETAHLRVALEPGQALRGMAVDVPGDFSSAAFFLLAGCLGARDELVIEQVGVNPTRTGLLAILELMGADVRVDHPRMEGREPVADLCVRRSRLRGADVPAALVPLAIDEFPAVFVAAACAEGVTRIRGAEELRHKESDRIAVMARALSALGVEVHERPDGADIVGGTLRGGEVDAAGDHRVAMALAMASLAAEAPIRIADTLNVRTSFPGFPELARSAGLALEVVAS